MSSLKSFDFTSNTQEEIIQKYEEVLYSRENQIEDLTVELGKVQLRNESLDEKSIKLNEEIERLKEIIIKKEKIISEELTSKEYIFMRLQDKEREVDTLNEKLKKSANKSQGIDALSQAGSKLTSFAGYLFGSKKGNNRKESNNNDVFDKELYKNSISNQNSNSNSNSNSNTVNDDKHVNSLYMSDKHDELDNETNKNNECLNNITTNSDDMVNKEKENIADVEKKDNKDNDSNNISIVENVGSKSLSKINEIKKKKNKNKGNIEQVDNNQ